MIRSNVYMLTWLIGSNIFLLGWLSKVYTTPFKFRSNWKESDWIFFLLGPVCLKWGVLILTIYSSILKIRKLVTDHKCSICKDLYKSKIPLINGKQLLLCLSLWLSSKQSIYLSSKHASLCLTSLISALLSFCFCLPRKIAFNSDVARMRF